MASFLKFRWKGHFQKSLGLSMVELLVAIAIITILVMLGMKGFQAARARGEAISCMNNLRQLGVALQTYTQDYNDTFPFPNDYHGAKTCWFNAVDPYLLNKTAATNKASENLHFSKQDPIVKRLGPSWVTNAHTIKMNQWLGEDAKGDRRFYSFKELSDASRTVLLVDGRAETEKLANGEPATMARNPQGSEGMVARRHLNQANVLFADGHVNLRKEKSQVTGTGLGWQINQTRLIWKPWVTSVPEN
jgi:prepilin-type processing-associated H-X9-DG protein